MAFLKKKNNAKTVIFQAGGITASDITITVADTSKFPTEGNFLITSWNKDTYPDPSDDINAEIILVTNVSGNIFTVTRGQEGTIAKQHANGHAVEMLITAGAFEEIEEAIGSGGVTAGDAINIDEGEVSVKADEDTIVVNDDDKLEVQKDNVLNTLFGQDTNGDLQPQEDYFGQGGFFEIDENYNRQSKESLVGVSDYFFELDGNNDIQPKE